MLNLVNVEREKRDVSRSTLSAKAELNEILKHAVVKPSNPFIPVEVDKSRTHEKMTMPQPYVLFRLQAGPQAGAMLKTDNGISLGATAEAIRRYDFCLSKSGLNFMKYNYVGGTVAIPGVSLSLGVDLKNNKYCVSMNNDKGLGSTILSDSLKNIRPTNQNLYFGQSIPFGIPLIFNLGCLYVEIGVSIPGVVQPNEVNSNSQELKGFSHKK